MEPINAMVKVLDAIFRIQACYVLYVTKFLFFWLYSDENLIGLSLRYTLSPFSSDN